MTSGRQRSLDGLLLAVLSAAAFGGAGALGKGLLESGWSSGAVVLARNGLGALLLAPVAIRALRRERPTNGQWGIIIAYGLLAVAGTQLFFFQAVQRLDVGTALLIEFLGPFLLVGLAWIRTRTRPPRATLLGAVAALVGMGLVVNVLGSTSIDPVGVGWALAAAVGVAAHFLVAARPMDGMPLVALAGGGTAVGSLMLAAMGMVGVVPMSASTSDAQLLGASRSWWSVVIVLGVISCALAYVTGIVAARRLGERVASFVGLTEVLFAVLFAWLLLGELPGLAQLGGGMLILTGLVLIRKEETASRQVELQRTS